MSSYWVVRNSDGRYWGSVGGTLGSFGWTDRHWASTYPESVARQVSDTHGGTAVPLQRR